MPLCILILNNFGPVTNNTKGAHRALFMANGIPNQLNKSLEISLRDGLDGLEDFTLQMAYASTGAQFEILPVNELATGVAETNVTKLTLASATAPEPVIQQKRHA